MTQIEQQYTDLFKQHQALIEKPCAELLNTARREAFDSFCKLGFPVKKNEEYLYTNVQEYFAPDFGLNINRLPVPVNPYEVFRCDVPNLSTALYFVVNDSFYQKESAKSVLPEGVIAGSLNEIAKSHPELIEKYYNKLAQNETDGSVAFNTSFVQDGFVLYVPKNVIVERPVQLVNILRGDVDFMVNRRILVIIEDGAQAKLLICDHTIDNVNFLATQVSEVFVGDNAVFDYYELEENSIKTTRVASTFVRQGANSNTMFNGITLHNGKTRNNVFVTFAGENSEANVTGMAIADQEQHIDNHTFIDHAVPRCHSNELFKYVLNDSAKGVFAGRILVRKDAQKTTAFQSNKNLCATREARMYTKPQLEIYADDVKCSHGATVGQLDENALFYLRSRGISQPEARMLLMFAFTNDVIENIRLDSLKDRLRHLVEKRFRGELAKCSGCAVCQ
ncbi:MAG: Fe-S cluster assembly protein SufD [Bacteroidales bacterium]